MEIPTTLVDAARALVATANPPLDLPARDPRDTAIATYVIPEGWTDNPTPPGGDPELVTDTGTAWAALTRRPTGVMGRAARVSEQRQRANGVDLALPEVVRVGPGPSRPSEALVSRPVRAEQRPRFYVPPLRPATTPFKFSPSPAEAFRVTYGGLSARLASDRLEAWIPSLLAGEATRARAEVEAYRGYAAAATEQLPGLFTWLALVPELAPAFPAGPTVPTILAGIGPEGS